jgi:hypothetical protein
MFVFIKNTIRERNRHGFNPLIPLDVYSSVKQGVEWPSVTTGLMPEAYHLTLGVPISQRLFNQRIKFYSWD